MDAEIKDQWVAALRSGDYAQGTNGLRNQSDEFCCLGVLCDLAIQSGKVEGSWSNPEGLNWLRFSEPGGDFSTSMPLESVYEWAGLSESQNVVFNGEDRSLPGLNDGGAPFALIADLIEEQL